MPSIQQKENAERSLLRVILAVPGCQPGATIEQIAEDAGLSTRQAWTILRRLRDRGKVRRVKAQRRLDGKSAWHFYHALPAKPRTGESS